MKDQGTYVKLLLTVIAVCLVIIALRGATIVPEAKAGGGFSCNGSWSHGIDYNPITLDCY